MYISDNVIVYREGLSLLIQQGCGDIERGLWVRKRGIWREGRENDCVYQREKREGERGERERVCV